jgi:alpha-tubulin suppressor-like RCC1 family protein
LKRRLRFAASPYALATSVVALAACGPAGNQHAVTVAPGGAIDAPGAKRAELPFELAMGASGACLREGGRVYCGQLDNPDKPLVRGPPFGGIEDAVSLSLNRSASLGCVVRKGGTVACFGSNDDGELGAGLSVRGSAKPVAVKNVRGAVRVIAGDDRACALLADGGVRCWGANDVGETGGSVSYRPQVRELVAPVAVDAAQGASDIALGWKTTCALAGAGGTLCWGLPFSPESQREPNPSGRPPWRLPGGVALQDIDAHYLSFCGVGQGEVFCWGEAQSFADSQPYADAPTRIGLTGVKRVRLGPQRACALHDDGRVSCWGFQMRGQLGRGDPPDSVGTFGPAVVSGLPPAVDLAFGESISCAVTARHDVYCWGSWLMPDGSERVETRPVKMRVFK